MSTATLFAEMVALAAGLLVVTLRRMVVALSVSFILVAGTYGATCMMKLTPREHADIPTVLLVGVVIGALFAICAKAAEKERNKPPQKPDSPPNNGSGQPPP